MLQRVTPLLTLFYFQSGGCCDCGDPDAWDANGFCPRHGLNNVDPLKELPSGIRYPGDKIHRSPFILFSLASKNKPGNDH